VASKKARGTINAKKTDTFAPRSFSSLRVFLASRPLPIKQVGQNNAQSKQRHAPRERLPRGKYRYEQIKHTKEKDGFNRDGDDV